MSRPTFDDDDFKLPDELVHELRERNSFWIEDIGAAYRAGSQAGYAFGKAEWPEPITDRPPTEADGDESGYVQILIDGLWSIYRWAQVAKGWGNGSKEPWFRTPRWQPPAPPTGEDRLRQEVEALRAENTRLRERLITGYGQNL